MTEESSLTGRLLVATPVLADPNFDRAVVLLLDHDEKGTLGVILNRPTPVDVGDILAPWAALAGAPGVVFQGGPVSLDAALGVAVVPSGGAAEPLAGTEPLAGETEPVRRGRTDGPGGAPVTGAEWPGGRGGAERPGEAAGAGTADAEVAPGAEEPPDAPGTPEPSGAPAPPGAPDGREPALDGPLGWRRVYGAIGLVDLEAPPELLAAELGSLRIFAGYAGWGPGQLEKELSEGAWYVVDSEPGDVSSPAPEGLWRAVLRRQRGELAMVATYPDDPSLN
ncbi:hypothetical protein E0L36_01080 [Streptomyces sp. AJS327]|uniref:YqgE/AlgH family protein n=1 Tax=Streptomyces sp. AJS327 TaxID=2545265 RepID=UPI0015DEE4AC|nr:YqgE/AlgH family protein [Streptomyces sp. AJS327]MBA0049551.1 hypothetical protein [Streptomyces sp. AJS327]